MTRQPVCATRADQAADAPHAMKRRHDPPVHMRLDVGRIGVHRDIHQSAGSPEQQDRRSEQSQRRRNGEHDIARQKDHETEPDEQPCAEARDHPAAERHRHDRADAHAQKDQAERAFVHLQALGRARHQRGPAAEGEAIEEEHHRRGKPEAMDRAGELGGKQRRSCNDLDANRRILSGRRDSKSMRACEGFPADRVSARVGRRNGAGLEIGQPHLTIGTVKPHAGRAAARHLRLGFFDRGGDRFLLAEIPGGIASEILHSPRPIVPDDVVRPQFGWLVGRGKTALPQLPQPRFLLLEPPLPLQHILTRLLDEALGHL